MQRLLTCSSHASTLQANGFRTRINRFPREGIREFFEDVILDLLFLSCHTNRRSLGRPRSESGSHSHFIKKVILNLIQDLILQKDGIAGQARNDVKVKDSHQ